MKFVSIFVLATVLVAAAYAGDKEPAPKYEEPAPAYEPATGYDAPPAYEPATGYDAPPAYEAPAAYDAAPAYAPAGGYGSSSGGYTAGHRFPRYKHNLYIAPPPFSGKSSWDGYLPSSQLKAGTGGIRTWTLDTFNKSYLAPASHYGLGFGSHGHGPTYQSYIHEGPDAQYGKNLMTDLYVSSPKGYLNQYTSNMWADSSYGAYGAPGYGAAPASGYGASSGYQSTVGEVNKHHGYGHNDYEAETHVYELPEAAAYEPSVSYTPPAKPAKEYSVPEATIYAPPAGYDGPTAAPTGYGKAPTPHYAEPAYAPAPTETYGEEPAYEVDDPQYAPASGGYGAARGHGPRGGSSYQASRPSGYVSSYQSAAPASGYEAPAAPAYGAAPASGYGASSGSYTAGHRFPRYKHNLYIAPPPFSGKSSWDGYLPSSQLKADAGGVKANPVPTFNSAYLPPSGHYGLGYGSHGHGPTYKSYLHDWGHERFQPTYATYKPAAGKGYLPGYSADMWADTSYGGYGNPGYGASSGYDAPAGGYAPAPAAYVEPAKVDYGEKASKEGNYVPQVSHEGYEPVQKAEVTHASYEDPVTHDAYEVKESPKPAAGYGGY